MSLATHEVHALPQRIPAYRHCQNGCHKGWDICWGEIIGTIGVENLTRNFTTLSWYEAGHRALGAPCYSFRGHTVPTLFVYLHSLVKAGEKRVALQPVLPQLPGQRLHLPALRTHSSAQFNLLCCIPMAETSQHPQTLPFCNVGYTFDTNILSVEIWVDEGVHTRAVNK